MPAETQTHVISLHRPWVRRLLWIGALVLLPLSIYVTYEIGRLDGGFDRFAAAQLRREQEVQVERLAAANAQLRAKVAELETGGVSQRQERAELAGAVSELQAQVARQSQDLAFYRGIVSTSVGAPTIKVQRFQVSPGSGARHFHLRMVLVQAVRPENIVAGTVALTVEGTERGRPANYPAAQLSSDARAPLPFSFRYFQDLDQEVILPEGFIPARVTVEVRAAGRAGTPSSQTFNWNSPAT